MKLLLIMPSFFDYPQIIMEELNTMGYDVDFFDDRPSTNGWIKAIIRVNKNLIKKYISDYFDKVMVVASTRKYDVVLLISGQSLSFTKDMIRTIKETQIQAKFILYQWDSLKNFPYIEQMKDYFEKCYTFDRSDAESHNYLNFMPLFYEQRYEKIGQQLLSSFKYDFCFIGTAHPKKYKFIKLMNEQLKHIYPNQFIYFFFPSKIVFFYRKIMNKELRKAHYKEFHFIPLKGEEIDQIYINSKCVLDSSQEGQVGLTIRVLEALGAKKKLITTNSDIKNYDFYRAENIYVYDGKFDLKSTFFTKDYVEIDEKIYCKYSLRSWLEELLS